MAYGDASCKPLYGKVTSTSNTTDYRARRLQIRYRKNGGRPRLLYTLIGTAIAVSRTLIPILENYQQEDGSVIFPEALSPTSARRCCSLPPCEPETG